MYLSYPRAASVSLGDVDSLLQKMHTHTCTTPLSLPPPPRHPHTPTPPNLPYTHSILLTASITISEHNRFRVDALVVDVDDGVGARLVARGRHDDRACVVGVAIIFEVDPLHPHVHQLTNLNTSHRQHHALNHFRQVPQVHFAVSFSL